MKLYLDLCCLKRPFDDDSQDRVRIEAEAVKLVLERIERGEAVGCNSEALEAENALNPAAERRSRADDMLRRLGEATKVTRAIDRRARAFEKLGFGEFDALHLACAVAAGAEVLLTCDDRFESRADRVADDLPIRIMNPVEFLRRPIH